MPSSALLTRAASSAAPVTAQELGQAAYLAASAAVDWGVPSDALTRAALALAAAGPDGRQRAAVDLLFAAADVARDAQQAGMLVLAEVVGDVQRAGLEFASSLELQAAAAARPERRCGWLRRLLPWGNDDGAMGDLEAPLLPRPPRIHGSLFSLMIPRSRASSSEDLVGIMGFALFGTLSLIPSMGSKGVMNGQDDIFKFWFQWIVVVWWALVALGVPCSQSPRCPLLLEYARGAARIGMIGISCLFIVYCHLLLGQDTKIAVLFVMAIVVGMHLSCWVLVIESSAHMDSADLLLQ
uniref:Uncharacterized protein n=1 Tax=Leersia perrieri TaxID=77586 RepID=A0A0D9V911_9ORYZ